MPVDEPLYPVNLRVAGRRCLVVGGGPVAADKARGLLECGARVHVVATRVGPEVRSLVAAVPADGASGGVADRADDRVSGGAALTWEERPYREGDVAGHRVVVTATDDPAVNRAVYLDGEATGVLVNSADDPANCAFTLPSRIRQGPLLVTFATGGHSPAVATWLRRRFSAEFGPEYVTLIELLAAERARMQADGESTEGRDWQSALDSGMLDLVREGRLAEAKERLQACLSSSSA